MTKTKSYFTYGVSNSDRDLVTSTVNYSGKLKRYFSSLDAEIFIGTERIIDIAKLEFNYTEQKLPVYGFNSFLPSRIFVGQKLVQGTFIINFTEVGYIANLLEKIDESKLVSPFERVGISCDSDNAALFKKCFDIVVGYGGYNVPEEASYNNTCQVIRGAYINGYQQILDTSGDPIYEVYSFIAKDIAYLKEKEVKEIINEPATGGKSVDLTVTESRLDSENDINSARIVADVSHSLLDSTSSIIEATFEFKGDINDKVDNVKLTLADNEIGISKTYTLSYYNNKWVCRLNSEDTNKIKKKLQTGRLATGSLEFELIKNSKNETENVTKIIGMYKNNGY